MDVHRLKIEGAHATGAPLVLPTPMYGNSLTQKDDSCKLLSGICCDCHVLVT